MINFNFNLFIYCPYLSMIFVFIAVNCVDRHYVADPDRVALIWERDSPGQQQYVTYK